MDAELGPPWERAEDQHPSSPCPEGQTALWAASPPSGYATHPEAGCSPWGVVVGAAEAH